jgi:hypothetical protein
LMTLVLMLQYISMQRRLNLETKGYTAHNILKVKRFYSILYGCRSLPIRPYFLSVSLFLWVSTKDRSTFALLAAVASAFTNTLVTIKRRKLWLTQERRNHHISRERRNHVSKESK